MLFIPDIAYSSKKLLTLHFYFFENSNTNI